ncbi:MAG: hypothetical protein A2Y57_00305 [Candidatus Woykebacteria bacterium RBG_13_40_7b]|uniref:M23ase beta-sheet core domain-containing protein n=1 Tax=Candidatus Woykebacteria bacterium RBG_13_40_7b TaxID=1802594 RepID=A0A1G1WAH1_9BACT|nr:MAG: hypothetical protein A2Y57_00305 [Candidatus Woykebacteria bacterium RBG_13_40_7b]
MARIIEAANPEEQTEIESATTSNSALASMASFHRNPNKWLLSRYLPRPLKAAYDHFYMMPEKGSLRWYSYTFKSVNRTRRFFEGQMFNLLRRTVGTSTGLFKQIEGQRWDAGKKEWVKENVYGFSPAVALGKAWRDWGDGIAKKYFDVDRSSHITRIKALKDKGWELGKERSGFGAAWARASFRGIAGDLVKRRDRATKSIFFTSQLGLRFRRLRKTDRGAEYDNALTVVWAMKLAFDLAFALLRLVGRYAVEAVPPARAVRNGLRKLNWTRLEAGAEEGKFLGRAARFTRLGFKTGTFAVKGGLWGTGVGWLAFGITGNPVIGGAVGASFFAGKVINYYSEWAVRQYAINPTTYAKNYWAMPKRMPWVWEAGPKNISKGPWIKGVSKGVPQNAFKVPVMGPTAAFLVVGGYFGLWAGVAAGVAMASSQIVWGTRQIWWEALKSRNVGWVLKVDGFFTVGRGSLIPRFFSAFGRIPATVFQFVNPGSLIATLVLSKLGIPFFGRIITMPWASLLAQVPIIGPFLSIMPVFGWLPFPEVGFWITVGAGGAWHYFLGRGAFFGGRFFGARLAFWLAKWGFSKLTISRVLIFFKGLNTGFWLYTAGEFAELALSFLGIKIPILSSWLGEILGGGYFAWRVGPTLIRTFGPFVYENFLGPGIWRAASLIGQGIGALSSITLGGILMGGFWLWSAAAITVVIAVPVAVIVGVVMVIAGAQQDPYGSAFMGGQLENPNIKLEKWVSAPGIAEAKSISLDNNPSVTLTYRITITNTSDVDREIALCRDTFKLSNSSNYLPEVSEPSPCISTTPIRVDETMTVIHSYQIPVSGFEFKDTILTNVFMICAPAVGEGISCDPVDGQNLNRASVAATVVIGKPPNIPPCGWPTNGMISWLFGPDYATDVEPLPNGHTGLDIQALGADWLNGQPVYATMTGKVVSSNWYSDHGGIVDVLQHMPDGSQIVTHYVHLDQATEGYWDDHVGEEIERGKYIGLTWPGYSGGTHLHYAIIIDGTHVNPLTYTPDPAGVIGTLVSAGSCDWLPHN